MPIAEDLIIGSSKEIKEIRVLISRVADSKFPVLISGESGTGKSLVALAIHQMSSQSVDSLLQFDCATTSEKFLEIELFGLEESGHVRKGLLEFANGRNLLLENIDHTPVDLQVKLLSIFQETEFLRRGGVTKLQTDCRIITTSRRDLREKIEANLFREDFYYRMRVISVKMPALRDRPEDIEPLIYEIVGRLHKDARVFMASLENHGLLEYFWKYSWPGNIRELQQVVETLVLTEAWESIRQILLGHGNASNQMIIERSIKFPPEYHQAGVSILSFFGEILRRKYPDHKATIRIEQDDLRVRMIVEPLNGRVEVFERALDEYGLVLTGQITPEQFTDDSFLAMNLKHELRLAQARIESQKELLQYQEKHLINRDRQIDQMLKLIGQSLHAPQPYNLDISVAPTISSTVDAKITVNVIEDIQNDLGELSDILNKSSKDAAAVEQVRKAVVKLNKSNGNETEKNTAIDKLKELIDSISDKESRIGKAIRATNHGVAIAQRLAKHYNDLAQWFGWPQVPKPFLGSDTNA